MTVAAPSDPIRAEALVIGAGPVGLYQIFQLGLHGIACHVVDSQSAAGGQCLSLYPQSRIYDIPAIASCTAGELARKLHQQAAVFHPVFHFRQEVSRLERQADKRFLLQTTAGVRFLAEVVVVAAGAGAIVPRRLKTDLPAAVERRHVFHDVADAPPLAGGHVCILGGADDALEQVLALACGEAESRPASISLLYRRDVYPARPERVAELGPLLQSGAVRAVTGQITGYDVRDDALVALHISTPQGEASRLPLDVLLVCQGVSPRTGALGDWGLAMERKLLRVDAATCATSEPGIFAVGDIASYPGKKKLIVSGFHECVQAAWAAATHLRPDAPPQLLYTSSSTQLQKRLGVKS